MLLIGGDRFIEHQTPEGHPEQPARARVMQEVSLRWVEAGSPEDIFPVFRELFSKEHA